MAKAQNAGRPDGPPDRPEATTARFPRRQGEKAAGQHPDEQLARPQPSLQRRCRAPERRSKWNRPRGLERGLQVTGPSGSHGKESASDHQTHRGSQGTPVRGREASDCRMRTDANGQIHRATGQPAKAPTVAPNVLVTRSTNEV